MDFQLQRRRDKTSNRALAFRTKGMLTSSSAPMVLPTPGPLSNTSSLIPDDRHGLIRATAGVLSLLSLIQNKPSVNQERSSEKFRPRNNLQGQHKDRRTGYSRLHNKPVQPAIPSFPFQIRRDVLRPATQPASVSVAAGEVAQQVSSKAAQQAQRPLQHLLAGGVAGAVSKTLVAPLERISTMVMADAHRSGLGVGEAVAAAWREGGLSGLFRGNAATLAKIFPSSAIQFAVFHGVKDTLLARKHSMRPGTISQAGTGRAGEAPCSKAGLREVQELTNAERLMAGAAAGAASVSFTYPLESARTLMSVAGGMEGSVLHVCRRMVASGGMEALYRGFKATLLGDVMGNALGFTFYEMGNRAWRDANNCEPAPPSVRGVIGAMSAAFTMTLTMPLEVVRRRLQVQGTLGRPILYRGTLDCISKIMQQEGLKGFYRAALPSYLKVAPSIGCMYFLYELLTRHLDPTMTVSATAAKEAAKV